MSYFYGIDDLILKAMKKMVKRLKKILQENKEDLQYLLYVGLPTGILLIVLSHYFTFGELN